MSEQDPEYDEKAYFRITHHLRTENLTFTGLVPGVDAEYFPVEGKVISPDIVLVPRRDETYFLQIASADSTYGEFVPPWEEVDA